MTWDLLADPVFRLPFLAGLLLAGVLPVLGVLLMLRDEWLAALGLAHLAAAGALLGIALGIPALFGAGLGACAGGMAKSLTGIRGNGAYAFMILIGWSGLMLVAANAPGGEALGYALIDGCGFHTNWTPIPAQAGHPFHANLDSRSEATRGVDAVYAGVGSSVNFGWSLRRDSPARLRGWAWWTRRSRMASARVGSPRASCQWATGNWLVTRVERV